MTYVYSEVSADGDANHAAFLPSEDVELAGRPRINSCTKDAKIISCTKGASLWFRCSSEEQEDFYPKNSRFCFFWGNLFVGSTAVHVHI